MYGSTVAPNNSVDVTWTDANGNVRFPIGLYVGGAGNVHVQWIGGGNTLFQAVPAGTVMDVRVQKVLYANTAATNIVALF